MRPRHLLAALAIAAAALTLRPATAAAADLPGKVVETIDWSEVETVPRGTELTDGPDGSGAVTVSSTTDLGTYTPAVSTPRWAVTGMVRYENVAKPGYLELNSYVDDGDQPFFTRTLGSNGPLAQLQGSSDWRPFTLPFDATGGPQPGSLKKMNLRVVIPSGGTVSVSDVEVRELTQQQFGQLFAANPSIGRMAGLIGSGVGLLGAAVGCGFGYVGIRRQQRQREEQRMKAMDA